MGSVEVNYELSDLYAVNFRAWRTYLKIVAVLETIFIALILVLPLIDGATLLQAIEQADWWFALGMGLILLIFYAGFCPLIGYFRSKRQKVLGPNYFSFDGEGVSVENAKAKSVVFWSGITRVLRSDTRLFLFIRPGVAFIIPRRALPSFEAFSMLAEEADARWRAARA